MKRLVTALNQEFLNKIKDLEDIEILYPLESFCIGYDYYYPATKIDGYALINRILTDDDLDILDSILKNSHFKGIVFDDLGILEIVKDLPLKKILLLDHLALNSISINYYLDYVDSVVVASDLNYEEIKYITENTKKEVVLYVFGLKKLMYSRRNLLTNYALYHQEEINKKLEAKILDKDFRIIEEDMGTSFFMGKYYNGLELLNLNNVLYYWYDFNQISLQEAIDILNNKVNVASSPFLLHDQVSFKVRGDK